MINMVRGLGMKPASKHMFPSEVVYSAYLSSYNYWDAEYSMYWEGLDEDEDALTIGEYVECMMARERNEVWLIS